MALEPHIFKAYDIRGKFPKELDADGARKIGNAVAVFLSRKYKKKSLRLLVGGDVRISTPVLKKALIEGIVIAGCDVVDTGTVTTPLFYFLLNNGNYDGGVMITASHNPSEYNGFKIRGRRASVVAEDSGLTRIAGLAAKKNIIKGMRFGHVAVDISGVDRYITFLKKKVKIVKARVVIDAAGGATTAVLPKLLHQFSGVIYKPLFFTPDTAERHDPNPLKEEAQDFIREELKNGNFDFGVLFDGDGDRVVFFDEFGNDVLGDITLAILAEGFIRKKAKSTVVVEHTARRAVKDRIRELGGTVALSKVGAVHVCRVMAETKAVLGGEPSGHFYFQDYGGNESGMYAFLKILEMISQTPRKLSHLIRPLRRSFYVSGQKLTFTVRNKKELLQKVVETYKAAGSISRFDGITVEADDWWFNLRPSNTEPLVRLTLEADTKELFETKKEELAAFIKKYS